VPVPVNVAAKLKRKLRGKENPGGLTGSYRHLFGVYVTTERSLCQWDVADEDLEEALEDVGEVNVETAVGCGGATALGEVALSAVVMTSRIDAQ